MCYQLEVFDIREYTTPDGSSPFARWFDRLNAEAAAKVAVALTRMQNDIQRALELWAAYKIRKRKET